MKPNIPPGTPNTNETLSRMLDLADRQTQRGRGSPKKQLEYATKGRLNADTGEYTQDPHWIIERQIIAGLGYKVKDWPKNAA